MSHPPAVPGVSRRLTSARAIFSKIAITALLGAGATLSLSPGAALAATGTTLYVSDTATSNPACSAASQSNPFATIAGALACATGADTIKIGAGTFAGGITIPANVVLDGAGANQTTISDPTQISSPEVTVAPKVSTTIENLTVSGKAGHNGGIVAGNGSLTLSRVTVDSGFAISSSDPAPVTVLPASGNAKLTVVDSTVSNGFDNVGGILVSSPSSTTPSTATIVNSTISGNEGQQEAGGIYLNNATLTARDDTIANNFGLIGGGLQVGANSAATVTDSLIATNTSGTSSPWSDCEVNQAGKITDGGHNLIGIANPGANNDCGFTNATNGDLTGTPTTPLNPDLGPLAANGGPTQTRALQPGSPAISAGNPTDCQATPVNDLDQRGATRAATTRFACDIGAYDTAGKGTTTLYVSSKAHTNPACSAASQSNPFATIAGALACATGADTIKIGAGTFAGGITIPANVVLDGAGANQTTISDPTQISSPEVTVAPKVSTTIENLAVSGKAGHNGGIVAGSGSLTLGRVTVDSGFAISSSDPAPVAVLPASGNASLTVVDSTVSNGFDNVGGILVSSPSSTTPSTATIVNSTISGNEGQQEAGGIYLNNATLTARDDTIANNFGLIGGGLQVGANSAATVTDSLIATNTSGTSSPWSDCEVNQAGKITDGGHNLIGIANPGANNDCGFTNGDLTGTPATPLNPDLGPLTANGGPTQTQALQPSSPAISTGNPTDCQATPVNDLDQRGATRAATTRHACDIGAYDTAGAA